MADKQESRKETEENAEIVQKHKINMLGPSANLSFIHASTFFSKFNRLVLFAAQEFAQQKSSG